MKERDQMEEETKSKKRYRIEGAIEWERDRMEEGRLNERRETKWKKRQNGREAECLKRDVLEGRPNEREIPNGRRDEIEEEIPN